MSQGIQKIADDLIAYMRNNAAHFSELESYGDRMSCVYETEDGSGLKMTIERMTAEELRKPQGSPPPEWLLCIQRNEGLVSLRRFMS